jgi:hypothetical protein
MKRLALSVALAVAAFGLAGCFGAPPPPAGPSRLTVGDSDAYLVAQDLPTENAAVGGSTACNTNLPDEHVDHVLVHVGGHSWANYDAATWDACTTAIVNFYRARGAQVFLALTPSSIDLYCGDPAQTTSVLDAAGIPHGDLYANPAYELRQRLLDANAWKLNQPGVTLVDWRSLGLGSDCTHFTPTSAQQAADLTTQRGF